MFELSKLFFTLVSLSTVLILIYSTKWILIFIPATLFFLIRIHVKQIKKSNFFIILILNLLYIMIGLYAISN